MPAIQAPALPSAPVAPVIPTPPAPKVEAKVEPSKPTTPVVEPAKAADLEGAYTSFADAAGEKLTKLGFFKDTKVVAPEVTPIAEPEATKVAPATDVTKVEPAVTHDPDDTALNAEIATATKGLSREQQQAFKDKTYKLRDANRKLKEAEATTAKAAELEAKIKEMESRVVDAPKIDTTEIDALRKRVEEQELELSGSRLEATEIYRKQVTEPLGKFESAAVALAKGYDDLEEADVIAALKLTGADRSREISRIAGEMSTYDQTEFFNIARDYAGIATKKTELLSNAKESIAKLESQRVSELEKTESARKAAWDGATKASWSKVRDTAPMLKPVEGNEPWNEALKSAEAFANSVRYEQLDVASQAEVMHRTAAWPLINGYAASLETQVAELSAEIERLQGASPNSGPTVTSEAKVADVNDGKSFADTAVNRLKAAGVLH